MNKNSSTKNYYDYKEKDSDSFDLSTHLVNLMWKEPFYARIIRSLNKIESSDIPTAGVIAKDGEFNLYWNKEFFSSLTKKEVGGIIKHECLHLLYEHTTTRSRDPHMIWNWAADLAINTQLQLKELPKGGLIPGRKFPKLSKEEKSKLTQKELNDHDEISKLIGSLPSGKTAEYYFSKLVSNETLKNISDENNMIKLFGDPMDDHDGWKTLTDEEREFYKEKIKNIVNEAVKEAQENGWGSISSSTQLEICNIFSNQINWKSQLKRFCGYSSRAEHVNTVYKLNRKYPLIHPGIKVNYESTIAIYIDESGSVNNDDLSKFYGELDSLSKHASFWIYKFDTNVDEKNGFLWEKGKKVNLRRTKIGGTNFEAPTQHALNNKDKFDGYIIFTDGLAPKPSPSPLKRGWVISSCGDIFKNYDKKDFVIKLN